MRIHDDHRDIQGGYRKITITQDLSPFWREEWQNAVRSVMWRGPVAAKNTTNVHGDGL